jgi:hypothetical protein
VLAIVQHAAVNPRLPRGDTVRVLLYLTTQLDDRRFQAVTRFQLMRRLGIKRGTAGRCLDRLELAGYLVPGPREGLRSTFRLSHPDDAEFPTGPALSRAS